MVREQASLRVVFRKRPLPSNETGDCLQLDEKGIRIVGKKGEKHARIFPPTKGLEVWPANYTNEHIFKTAIEPHVERFLEGGCGDGLVLLAYGQTGSGKTYTLLGERGVKGLLGLCVDRLFRNLPQKMTLAVYEIYKERMNSLLGSGEEVPKWMNLMEASGGVPVVSAASAHHYIYQAGLCKRMGVTKANDNSSRSHTIYRLSVGGRQLICIDLAGTERGCYSVGKNRADMQEGSSINQSLFALKECIRALQKRAPHVPYRRSRLTMALSDVFRRNYHIHFVATLSSCLGHSHDTLDTVRYGYSLHHSDMAKLERRVEVQESGVEGTSEECAVMLKAYYEYIMRNYSHIRKYQRLYMKYSKGNSEHATTRPLLELIEGHRLMLTRGVDCFLPFRNVEIRCKDVVLDEGIKTGEKTRGKTEEKTKLEGIREKPIKKEVGDEMREEVREEDKKHKCICGRSLVYKPTPPPTTRPLQRRHAHRHLKRRPSNRNRPPPLVVEGRASTRAHSTQG